MGIIYLPINYLPINMYFGATIWSLTCKCWHIQQKNLTLFSVTTGTTAPPTPTSIHPAWRSFKIRSPFAIASFMGNGWFYCNYKPLALAAASGFQLGGIQSDFPCAEQISEVTKNTCICKSTKPEEEGEKINNSQHQYKKQIIICHLMWFKNTDHTKWPYAMSKKFCNK